VPVQKLPTNRKEDSMNLHETVALMFPQGVVTQSIPEDSNFFEVHGISHNFVPRNCAVLASGQFQYFRDQDRTGSYLVQTGEHVFFIRVYPTQSGGSRAEVALRYGFESENNGAFSAPQIRFH
jgi:hypothetical protein